MPRNFLAPVIKNEFDLSPSSKAIRYLYHHVKHRVRSLQNAPSQSFEALSKVWWYYGVELAPGLTANGFVPHDLPFGPRILMRKCNLAGMDCIDLGTMEGVTPVLMRRGGAKTVVGVDASYHCYSKLMAVKKAYGVDFSFRQVGLMYDLNSKLEGHGDGYDLVVLGGVLYHVFSPLHVLAGARPLLKENGILLVSTNVVKKPDFSAVFNGAGSLQAEPNTFWYLSIPMLEYALRYFGLLPIDCMFVPHYHERHRVSGLDSGLITIACRATNGPALGDGDVWGRKSIASSWEYKDLCNVDLCRRRPTSQIQYTGELDRRFLSADNVSIDVLRAVEGGEPMRRAERLEDSYLLRLSDRS